MSNLLDGRTSVRLTDICRRYRHLSDRRISVRKTEICRTDGHLSDGQTHSNPTEKCCISEELFYLWFDCSPNYFITCCLTRGFQKWTWIWNRFMGRWWKLRMHRDGQTNRRTFFSRYCNIEANNLLTVPLAEKHSLISFICYQKKGCNTFCINFMWL